MGSFLRKLRSLFLAGILVIVPVIATVLALRLLFHSVDNVLGPWIGRVLHRQIPGLGLAATILLIFLVGLLATNFLGRWLIAVGERVFGSVPLVRSIYSAAREIVHALATPREKQPFKEVVLVEYPRRGAYAYAFVTAYTTLRTAGGEERVAHVMVPSTPIPTTGWILIVPVRDLIYLDLGVDAAIRALFSAGAVAPPEIRAKTPPA
ncbi:MAG: DUF502 domain-containing protein [Candidatus Eisenbacteria bacterium]|nr:DUF502 domain-containing protein [Candidatus Eisenbacteria bacterium]